MSVKLRGYWFFLGVLLVTILVLSRCGTELLGPQSGTFSHVYSATLKKACIECHVPTGSATVDYSVKLDFSSQSAAYDSLTTSSVNGATSSNRCGKVKIVVAGDPEKSYMAAVLFTDYHKSDFAGESGCIPYSEHHQSQNLSSTEKESIVAWIRNGAKND